MARRYDYQHKKVTDDDDSYRKLLIKPERYPLEIQSEQQANKTFSKLDEKLSTLQRNTNDIVMQETEQSRVQMKKVDDNFQIYVQNFANVPTKDRNFNNINTEKVPNNIRFVYFSKSENKQSELSSTEQKDIISKNGGGTMFFNAPNMFCDQLFQDQTSREFSQQKSLDQINPPMSIEEENDQIAEKSDHGSTQIQQIQKQVQCTTSNSNKSLAKRGHKGLFKGIALTRKNSEERQNQTSPVNPILYVTKLQDRSMSLERQKSGESNYRFEQNQNSQSISMAGIVTISQVAPDQTSVQKSTAREGKNNFILQAQKIVPKQKQTEIQQQFLQPTFHMISVAVGQSEQNQFDGSRRRSSEFGVNIHINKAKKGIIVSKQIISQEGKIGTYPSQRSQRNQVVAKSASDFSSIEGIDKKIVKEAQAKPNQILTPVTYEEIQKSTVRRSEPEQYLQPKVKPRNIHSQQQSGNNSESVNTTMQPKLAHNLSGTMLKQVQSISSQVDVTNFEDHKLVNFENPQIINIDEIGGQNFIEALGKLQINATTQRSPTKHRKKQKMKQQDNQISHVGLKPLEFVLNQVNVNGIDNVRIISKALVQNEQREQSRKRAARMRHISNKQSSLHSSMSMKKNEFDRANSEEGNSVHKKNFRIKKNSLKIIQQSQNIHSTIQSIDQSDCLNSNQELRQSNFLFGEHDLKRINTTNIENLIQNYTDKETDQRSSARKKSSLEKQAEQIDAYMKLEPSEVLLENISQASNLKSNRKIEMQSIKIQKPVILHKFKPKEQSLEQSESSAFIENTQREILGGKLIIGNSENHFKRTVKKNFSQQKAINKQKQYQIQVANKAATTEQLTITSQNEQRSYEQIIGQDQLIQVKNITLIKRGQSSKMYGINKQSIDQLKTFSVDNKLPVQPQNLQMKRRAISNTFFKRHQRKQSQETQIPKQSEQALRIKNGFRTQSDYQTRNLAAEGQHFKIFTRSQAATALRQKTQAFYICDTEQKQIQQLKMEKQSLKLTSRQDSSSLIEGFEKTVRHSQIYSAIPTNHDFVESIYEKPISQQQLLFSKAESVVANDRPNTQQLIRRKTDPSERSISQQLFQNKKASVDVKFTKRKFIKKQSAYKNLQDNAFRTQQLRKDIALNPYQMTDWEISIIKKKNEQLISNFHSSFDQQKLLKKAIGCTQTPGFASKILQPCTLIKTEGIINIEDILKWTKSTSFKQENEDRDEGLQLHSMQAVIQLIQNIDVETIRKEQKNLEMNSKRGRSSPNKNQSDSEIGVAKDTRKSMPALNKNSVFSSYDQNSGQEREESPNQLRNLLLRARPATAFAVGKVPESTKGQLEVREETSTVLGKSQVEQKSGIDSQTGIINLYGEDQGKTSSHTDRQVVSLINQPRDSIEDNLKQFLYGADPLISNTVRQNATQDQTKSLNIQRNHESQNIFLINKLRHLTQSDLSQSDEKLNFQQIVFAQSLLTNAISQATFKIRKNLERSTDALAQLSSRAQNENVLSVSNFHAQKSLQNTARQQEQNKIKNEVPQKRLKQPKKRIMSQPKIKFVESYLRDQFKDEKGFIDMKKFEIEQYMSHKAKQEQKAKRKEEIIAQRKLKIEGLLVEEALFDKILQMNQNTTKKILNELKLTAQGENKKEQQVLKRNPEEYLKYLQGRRKVLSKISFD